MTEESKHSQWGCGQGCMMLAGLALILLIVAHTGIRYFVRGKIRSGKTPEELAQIQSFVHDPVDLPEEWFTPLEQSEEIQRRLQELDALYDQNKFDPFNTIPIGWMSTGVEYPDPQWQRFDAAYEAIQPFMDKIIELGRVEGYDVAAWAAETARNPFVGMTGGTPGPPSVLLQLQTYAKILNARAVSLSRQERWPEAFAHNLAAHRLAQRSPLTTMIVSLVTIALTGFTSDTTMLLAQECGDDAALEDALNELVRIRPNICFNDLNRTAVIDALGLLRTAKFLGDEVDITPGKTGLEYTKEVVRWQEESAARQAAQTGMPQPPTFPLRRMGFAYYLGYGSLVDEVLCSIAWPNMQNAMVREKASISQFGAACLSLAHTRAKTAGVTEISGSQDLMPAFLKEELRDPFAAGPSDFSYLFDTQRKVFYSVGPDCKDDRNAVEYNSSNGINSSGDISVPRKRPPGKN